MLDADNRLTQMKTELTRRLRNMRVTVDPDRKRAETKSATGGLKGTWRQCETLQTCEFHLHLKQSKTEKKILLSLLYCGGWVPGLLQIQKSEDAGILYIIWHSICISPTHILLDTLNYL